MQTIAVDAPGSGKSTRYPRPRRMPGIARTFELLLDALGYGQVDVLGVSFGGALAQQLAHQAPGRVRRLVLAATGPGVPGLGGVPGSPRAMLALASPRRYQSPDYFRNIAGSVYGGEARRDPDAFIRHSMARFSEPPTMRGYNDQLYAISFWTGLPWLWQLPQPTLVLAGDDDPIVPAINGRILARVIRTRSSRSSTAAATCSCSNAPPRSPPSSPSSSQRIGTATVGKTRTLRDAAAPSIAAATSLGSSSAWRNCSFDAGDLEFAGRELAVGLAVAATFGERAAVADEHASEHRRGALLGLRVGAAETDQAAGAVIAGGQRADVGAHVSGAAALREGSPLLGGRGAQCVLAV